MAGEGNPFGNLSYGQYVPTYVGLPLDRAKETADVLHEKYSVSKENASKLEIALANVPVLEKDEAIRTEATQYLNNSLQGVKEKGNWEDAPFVVQSAATDVAKNRGLLAATKSSQMKAQQEEALKARVDKGELLQEDLEYETAKAQEKYQGVKQNPITGAWEGFYSMNNPPTYTDIGKYTDDFLNGYKSDEWMGQYVKGKDGKWYKGNKTGEITEDGQYLYMPSTEEATYDEVYMAARHQVLQNQQIQERLDYDLNKRDINYLSKVSADPNAKAAMTHDLVELLGFDENKVKAMDDESLTKLHEREMMVHTAIEGSSLKHSYRKEKFQTLGTTWAYKQWDAKMKTAAAGGGDEETIVVDQTYVQLLTKGYTPAGNPASFEEYSKLTNNMKAEDAKKVASIADQNKKINDWKADPKNKGKEVPAVYHQELATMEVARARNANGILELEKRYAEAIDIVNKKLGIDYTSEIKSYEDFRKDKGSEELAIADNAINNITTIQQLTGIETSRLIDDRGIFGYDEKVISKTILNAYDAKNKELGKVPTVEEKAALYKAIQEQEKFAKLSFVGYKKNIKGGLGSTYGAQDIVNRWGQFEKNVGVAPEEISKTLKEISDSKTADYAFIDISKDFSKSGEKVDSQFSANASAIFRDSPHNFNLISVDGKEIGFEDNPDNQYYNKNNVKILGPTSDYVHEHGICFVASEEIMNADNKPTGQLRQHLFKDTSGSLKALATKQMQQGRLIKDGKVQNEKGFQEMDDAIYKMMFDEVDSQIARFQNQVLVPPPLKGSKTHNTIDMEVTLGPSKYAKVTKSISRSSEIGYEVDYFQIEKDGSVTNKGREPYSTVSNLERALEVYAGYGKEKDVYAVDLGTLQKITEAEIPYATFENSMQSMPRLHAEFKNEFVRMANDAKLNFVVTSMTRSKNLNSDKEVNGDPDSGHLYGKGIDISLKQKEGLKLYNWLIANSTPVVSKDPKKPSNYRIVNGYKMKFEAHDRGTGNHIDLKFID